jgi:hydroxymethylpyrimidine/phosphomethylpyrimidine kinase
MVEAVASILEARAPGVPLVVDPVMVSESGFPLLEDGLDALRTKLLPHTTVVTPNLGEAEALSGMKVESLEAMHHAAEHIAKLGPAGVLVKGGHAAFALGTDVLWCGGSGVDLLPTLTLPEIQVHGTGCTLASALATRLALGDDIEAAARAAKGYVEQVMAAAPDIGRGERRPGQHFPG